MADPDDDPNASPDLEADAHQVNPAFQADEATGEVPPALPIPGVSQYPQPPGVPNPRNLSSPKQTPALDFGDRPETPITATPHLGPTTGPTPTALP